ncbi:hypothetical protein Gotur_014578 [Gossypium turneri]
MESRLKQGGEGGRAEADPARREGDKKGAYWFQEKKGSVFPVKKKLVMTRMAECIANSSSSKMGGSSNTTVTNTTPPKSSKSNKISTWKYGAYIPSKPVRRQWLKVGAERATEEAAMVHVGDRGSNKKMDDASHNADGLEWDDAMVMVANDKGSGRRSGERETDRQRCWRSLVEVVSDT